MRNASPSRSREQLPSGSTAPGQRTPRLRSVEEPASGHSSQPGRYPRRGLAALVLTIGGLALLSSFKSPSELAILASTASFAPAQAMGGASTSATALPAGQGGAGSGDPGSADAASDVIAADPGGTSPNTAVAGGSQPAPADPAGAQRSPRVFTGDTVRTRFGPVQVQVTLTGQEITDVLALQLPFERSYSAEISRAVEPMLREEALRVQGGRMRLVSGATYTSEAYAESLQSAIDQAV